jgi:2-phospho-L-lactate guanylyltransferase
MSGNQTWAVLPAKPFDEAKSRLDPVLTAYERHGLARALLLQTLEVLQAVAGVDHVLVVSADPVVLKLAADHEADVLQETLPGLNRALTQARRHALQHGAQSLLVLAPDLPLLGAADVDAFFIGGDAGLVIAPDRRRRGTNALLLRPPDVIEFAFGESSFERHLTLAATAGAATREIELPGLAFDLDVAEDWHDLLALGWRPEGVSAPGLGIRDSAIASKRAPATPAPRPHA